MSLINAITYKEWLKTRWIILSFVLITISMFALWGHQLAESFKSEGALSYTFRYGLQGRIYQDYFKYFPVSFATFLSLFQFIPEINNNRYRLSVSLPYNPNAIIICMLLYGVFTILTYLTLLYSGYYLIGISILPEVIISSGQQLLITWFLTGIFWYVWLSATVFEINRIYQAILCLIGFGFLLLSLSATNNGTTASLQPYILLLIPGALFLAIFTFYRLRKGLI